MNPAISGRSGHPAAITLLMALILAAFVSQIPAVMVTGTALCAAYAFAANSRVRVSRNDFIGFVTLCAALFSPAFVKPYHGLSPIFYFVSTLAVFFAAQAATREPPQVLLAVFRRIYGVSLVLIAWVLYTYWGYPEPFGMAIEGSSTNGIPAYLIVIQIGLSLCSYVVNRRLPMFSAVATGVVAFFGTGRGSLVVAGLIIAGTLLLNLVSTSRSKTSVRLYFLVVFIAVAVALAMYGEELLEWIASYTKLSVGLMDANRLEIWDDYWRKIDPLTFLFGADYAGTVIEYEYGGNPHIAYIRTHSFFGLPLTVLALISPAFVFLGRKTLTAKLVFAFFIGMGALRALSEPIFFPTLLDFFYFSYFFLFFRYAPAGRAARTHAAIQAVTP